MSAWLQLFDGEKFYLEQDADGATKLKNGAAHSLDTLMKSVATTPANKVDGRLSDTLRNVLFGAFGEDLVSRNIFRDRDVGMASYKELTKCFGSDYRPQVRCLVLARSLVMPTRCLSGVH